MLDNPVVATERLFQTLDVFQPRPELLGLESGERRSADDGGDLSLPGASNGGPGRAGHEPDAEFRLGAAPTATHLSSALGKEGARLGRDVSPYVPAAVSRALRKMFA